MQEGHHKSTAEGAKRPVSKEGPVFLENAELARFVEERHIDPADYYLLERLYGLPWHLVATDFQKVFRYGPHGYGEGAVEMLRALVGQTTDEQERDVAEALLILSEKYGVKVCNHLVRAFEISMGGTTHKESPPFNA